MFAEGISMSSLMAFLTLLAIASTNGRFILRETAVFDGGAHNVFLDIEGATFLPDGSWIVADKLAFRILSLTSSGTATSSAGGRGRAAGQFMGPGPITAFGDTVVVADFASPRIQIFSRNLWFRNTFLAPGPVFNLQFDGKGKLWVGGHGLHVTSFLARYDLQGNELLHIEPNHSTGDLFKDVFRFVVSRNGKIALVYQTQNVVEIWNTDGSFVRSFEIPHLPSCSVTHPLEGIDSPSALNVPDEPIFRDIAIDPRDQIYILAEGYTPHPLQDVYVCTADGTLISTIMLPQKAWSIWFSPDGFLFAVTGNRDVVRKYAISFH